MEHKNREESDLIVEDTDENFRHWLAKTYLSPTLRTQLSGANVLIVPREGYADLDMPLFPNGTEELLSFLKSQKERGISADICIEDKDYRELTLHVGLIILGAFVVTSILAPVVADLISEYIKRRWPKKFVDSEIKFEITVVKEDGSAKKFLYEGPAKDIEAVVKPALKTFAEQAPRDHSRVSRQLPNSNDE